MLLALSIPAMVVGYAFIGGVIGSAIYRWRIAACADCSRDDGCYDNFLHTASGIAAGISWPLALPMIGGIAFAAHLSTREERAESRERRKKQAHQRTVAELEAKRRLTLEQREKMLVDIQFLAQNGIKADVPGLYDSMC